MSCPEIPEAVSAWIQGPYAHQIGKPLPLDARGSYSTRGDLVTYEWDLDGDGQYEIESTEPMLAHTWESEYVGGIHLRVTVPQGFTDTASTDAMFTNDGDGISDERDPHGTAQPRPQHGTDPPSRRRARLHRPVTRPSYRRAFRPHPLHRDRP